MTHSRIVLILCAALAASACSAPASRTEAASEPGGAVPAAGADVASATDGAAAAEDDPIVCHSVPRTGTRVAKRTCMRQSVLEKRARDAQEMLGDVQRRSVQGSPSSD